MNWKQNFNLIEFGQYDIYWHRRQGYVHDLPPPQKKGKIDKFIFQLISYRNIEEKAHQFCYIRLNMPSLIQNCLCRQHVLHLYFKMANLSIFSFLCLFPSHSLYTGCLMKCMFWLSTTRVTGIVDTPYWDTPYMLLILWSDMFNNYKWPLFPLKWWKFHRECWIYVWVKLLIFHWESISHAICREHSQLLGWIKVHEVIGPLEMVLYFSLWISHCKNHSNDRFLEDLLWKWPEVNGKTNDFLSLLNVH